jgi:hypothetical protein
MHWPSCSSPRQVTSVSTPLAAKNAALSEATAASISTPKARNASKSAEGLPDNRVGSGASDGLRVTCGVSDGDCRVAVRESLDGASSFSSEQPTRIRTAKEVTATSRHGVRRKYAGKRPESMIYICNARFDEADTVYRSLTGSGKSPSRAASIISRASRGMSMPNSSNFRSAQRPIWRGSL